MRFAYRQGVVDALAKFGGAGGVLGGGVPRPSGLPSNPGPVRRPAPPGGLGAIPDFQAPPTLMQRFGRHLSNPVVAGMLPMAGMMGLQYLMSPSQRDA